LGFWEKPFHYRFSFSGAISTLARQEEDSSRVLIGVHLVLDFILEGVGKHIGLHRVSVVICRKRPSFRSAGARRVDCRSTLLEQSRVRLGEPWLH
jgi:hypothetical protein